MLFLIVILLNISRSKIKFEAILGVVLINNVIEFHYLLK